ncbi:MAG TPA: efflux RND transporter periplasmic adaptor subunit [Gemmatimonadales bacterium]
MRAWLLVPLALAPAAGCGRPDGRIRGVGTLEAVEVDVAPMAPARVVRVFVEEGATVSAGDTLVSLTQPTSLPDVDQRRARLASAEAALRELEAGSRPREIERARADLAAAEAEADRTARDYARNRPLGETGAISRQALDAARSAAELAAARRDAARETLRLLEEGARPERIQAARAEVATAQAALAAAQATAADLVLTAPVNGTVLSRNAEPGEMLGAGQSALTLGEVRHPWVRVYVSSLVVPRVRVGQAAVATLDGMPDRQFGGRVVAINDRAEYTPRIALTEKERADLLFGVKVAFDDSTGILKPGLPATVEILAPSPAP